MDDTQYTILCVDDDPSVLAALKRELRREAYDVRTVTGGEDAMAVLKAEPVAAIISDENMPGIGGVALLQWAKEAAPRTVRILLTQHYDDPAVTIPAINCAAVFWFMAKPWDGQEVRAVVREAVDRYARETAATST
jgi:DNA-binding NtrC family response regulator